MILKRGARMSPDIAKALVKFHQQLKPISKDAKNPFFGSDYLTLSGILDAVRPILTSCDLAVMQSIKVDSGINILITHIIHASGQSLTSEMILPSIQDAQKFGSLITYYKRYQLQAMLGISSTDEDDDGNSVSTPKAVNNNTQQRLVGANSNPASPAQLNALARMNIPFKDGISKSEASALIDQANKR
jgi:hypothetical protein